MRKIAVSLVTINLQARGKLGPQNTRKLLNEVGLDGVQFLPPPGFKNKHIPLWEPMVISFEGAWNFEEGFLATPKGWLWATLRLAHKANKLPKLYPIPSPTWIDMLLFGKKYSPAFPNAIQVEHSPCIPAAALEINHPDLDLSLADYAELVRTGKKFVVDVRYFRRTSGVDWRKLLTIIPAEQIALIHFKPVQMDHSFYELLLYLKAYTRCPVVIEGMPRLQPYSYTVDELKETLLQVRTLLD